MTTTTWVLSRTHILKWVRRITHNISFYAMHLKIFFNYIFRLNTIAICCILIVEFSLLILDSIEWIQNVQHLKCFQYQCENLFGNDKRFEVLIINDIWSSSIQVAKYRKQVSSNTMAILVRMKSTALQVSSRISIV